VACHDTSCLQGRCESLTMLTGAVCSLRNTTAIVYIFLGTLRDYEVERVQDRVGQAIVETLLAMTIFRQRMETFGFVSRFVLLAFVKMFHWMAQDRVDFIETTANTTRTQHMRLVSMIIWLGVVDVYLLHNALASVFEVGVSAHLLFAFEYSMQVTLAMAIFLKYIFSLIDMHRHGAWRGKSIAIFYVDLTKDLVHLITYTAFFFVVFSTYGIPIHLIRDIYWTFRNFTARVRAFLRFRQISSTMEDRFPTATDADLVRGDPMCIVCREDMAVEMGPKRLPCGHCFHVDCLKSWLERQQNCPICRRLIPAEEEEEGEAVGGDARNNNRGGAHDAVREEAVGAERIEEEDGRVSPVDVAQEERRDSTRVPDREAFLRRLDARRQGERPVEVATAEAGIAEEEAGPSTSPLVPEISGIPEVFDSQEVSEALEGEQTLDQSDRQPETAPGPTTSPSRWTRSPPVLLFPSPETMMFDLPTFEDDPSVGDALRRAASEDLDLHPTDEQHERALAIAKASAHAAAIAAVTTEML
jgi:E3 ubiquitin-protein ligase synoviolin